MAFLFGGKISALIRGLPKFQPPAFYYSSDYSPSHMADYAYEHDIQRAPRQRLDPEEARIAQVIELMNQIHVYVTLPHVRLASTAYSLSGIILRRIKPVVVVGADEQV